MYFEERGFAVSHEHVIQGDGAVDVLAERPGERVAVEIETGKSDIKENLANMAGTGFDRVVLIATSAAAATACHKAMESVNSAAGAGVELLTWLDVS